MSLAKPAGRRWVLLLAAIWAASTIAGLAFYSGSGITLVLFSLAFFLLAIDCLIKPAGYSYYFLTAFVLLGYWAKLMLHLYNGHPYLEPVGLFDGSGKAWDEVLTVSTVGVFGIFLGKRFFAIISRWPPGAVPVSRPFRVPVWFVHARVGLWVVTGIVTVALAIINMMFGIAQVGLAPGLQLPWPLNGLLAWTLGFGMAAWISTLLFWDMKSGKGFLVGWVALLVEGCLSSISALSRATYLFHTLPALCLLVRKCRGAAKPRGAIVAAMVVSWLFLFIVTLAVVMEKRYQDSLFGQEAKQALYFSVQRISRLVVDRWIGIEGVMAVSSYPDKSLALLAEGLAERRVRDKLDLYTTRIAKIDISEIDVGKVRYASLPGVIAFFYYTGSYGWVLLGAAVLTGVMLCAERLVMRLSENPYLAGLWGMATAQAVASFGIGNIQQLVYFTVCFALVVIICAIQNLSWNPRWDRRSA